MRRLASSVFVLSGLWWSTVAQASGRVVLYPGVARLAGANNTAWRSDAVFHNPTATAQTVQLELLLRGASNVVASAPLTLAVGETRQIDNLFDFLHASDGAGMLRVTGDVIAWVRTYNQGSSGSFGQDLAAVEPGGGYGPSEVAVFPFSTAPDIKTAFRSNILVVNLEAVAITVTFAAGSIQKTTTVPAGAYAQVDNLGAFLGTPAGFGAVRVTAGGRWYAAVSTVDPVTGDPTTVRGLGAGETDRRLFAGVAKAAGANGTAWRSEATLFNPSDASVTATLELIPRGASAVAATKTLTLAAGETRRLADVYDTLGVGSGAGALRVSGGVLAWVRTFNQGAQGTFGQDLPPIETSSAVGASVPAALPFRAAASIQTDFRSNLVVENLEDHDITLSIRAGAVTKTQVVAAGVYTQIDNLGSFLGLPPGAGTVWVQADGMWAGTVSTIDPFTGDPTTLRDDRTYRPPTSYDLIDAALAAQTINAEQALTYKVYVDFADSRLPAPFHGDDRNLREGSAVGEARGTFSTLSPATQELIGPFLVPPFYEGSWWDLRRSGGSGARAAKVTCRPWLTACSLLTGDWGYVDGVHVRVWYLKAHASDATIAAELATAADFDVWPCLTTSIGRTPKPDGTSGGNSLYDVALVDGLPRNLAGATDTIGFTNVSACRDTPAFSYINRLMSDPGQRKATLAHEIFHGAQAAVPGPTCLPASPMKWLTESTATWFEDYVYKDLNSEQATAPHYLNRTDLSIDNANNDASRPYGGYVFFYYLTRIRGMSPSIIGDIWNATTTRNGIPALDAALRAAGAELDTTWPDFAVYAWNRWPPFDKFFSLDTLGYEGKPIPWRSGSLGAPSASWEIIPKSYPPLPPLSIHYFQYDFPDATVSSLGFFNGLTRSLDTITAEEYGDLYSAAELQPTGLVEGAHITALKKIDGTWTQEDWTDAPGRTFCRDFKQERVQSLVVILSNASINAPSTVKVQGKYPPLLFASNIGCGPWEGIASLTHPWGDSVVENMVVTGLRLEPITDGYWNPDTPWMRVYTVAGGGYAWDVGGYDQSCSYSGSYSAPLTSAASVFHLIPWIVRGVGYRGFESILFWEWLPPLEVMNKSCSGGSETRSWNGATFVLGAVPRFTWARVAPDGKSITINAASIYEDDRLTGSWHLVAKREN